MDVVASVDVGCLVGARDTQGFSLGGDGLDQRAVFFFFHFGPGVEGRKVILALVRWGMGF